MRAVPYALILFLLLLGCQSSSPPRPEPGENGAAKEKEAEPEKPKNLLAENERSQLYFDLDQYTGRYMAAREEGNARAWLSLHASVLMPMVDRNLDELLRTVRSTGEPRYRLIAARALGFGSRSERIVPALVSLLGDAEPNLVSSALVSIYLLGWDRTPIEPLVQLLNHTDMLVRSNDALALYAVFRARAKEEGGAVRMTTAVREASGRLVAIAHRPEEDPFVRAHAASALGAIGDPAAADVLINLLIDEYMVVRIHAAQGLGNLGQESAIVPLIKMLRSAESGNEARIIAASLEKIAIALGYPCDGEALGTDEGNWRSWYEAVRSE